MVKCWVECLWAAWAAAAVHVVNMVLKPSTLDMVRRAAETSVHSFSSFTAASADVVGVMVDMVVDRVYFLRQMFRVRWLAEWVVAPAVLCYCCGPSLAALWVAAASASGLMLRAIAVGCWRLTAALVRGGLVDAGWHRGCERGDFVSCSSGHGRRGLWSAALCRQLLSLSSAAPHWRSRSVAWTRCCLVLREWLRLGGCTLRWCVPLLLLGGLPVAAATDNHDGPVFDIAMGVWICLATIPAALTATCWLAVLFCGWYLLAGVCGLAVLFWLYHQPCQEAVAEEVECQWAAWAAEKAAAEKAAAEEAAAEEAAAEEHLRRAWLCAVCAGYSKCICAVATPRVVGVAAVGPLQEGRSQQVKQQQREQYEEQPAAAEMARNDQQKFSNRRRRRHRVRRRAGGAPRSMKFASGKWINLPRARQKAQLVVASVTGSAQQQCRFHLAGGCARSQCTFDPPGHAPIVDGVNRLDQLMEAELSKLRARVTMLEMQMQHS